MSPTKENPITQRTNVQLPKDGAVQHYVAVSAILAGSIYLQDKEVFEDSLDKETGQRVPTFSFFLEHSEHGRILFDLGVRKHGKGYPPALDEDLKLFAISCERDVADQLRDTGIEPKDIKIVIYSHLHFDHVGDLTPFSSAQLVVGADAASYTESPYPQDPESAFQAFPKGQKVHYLDFASPEVKVKPLGPFPCAVDYFNDGSLYLIDAQGHFPGHLAALARTGPNQFVLLAGDCCHNRLCYNPGERLVSRENHFDVEVAREMVKCLQAMHQSDNVVVLLAHENERVDEMPLFPLKLNGWAAEEMKRKNIKRGGIE